MRWLAAAVLLVVVGCSHLTEEEREALRQNNAAILREKLSHLSCDQRCVYLSERCRDRAHDDADEGRQSVAYAFAPRDVEAQIRDDLRGRVVECRDRRDECLVLCTNERRRLEGAPQDALR